MKHEKLITDLVELKRYTAKQLTTYADKIGFTNPNVWYSKMDGWWLETDKKEVYLGAYSAGAKNKLTELCEGIYAVKKQGGKRLGSGQKKKYGEETTTIAFRCPLSKVPELKNIVNLKLLEWSNKGDG